MRLFKYFAVCLALAVSLASCKKEDKPSTTNDGSVTGEWKLVSWSALSSAEVYLSFKSDNTFDLYQRVYSPGFRHLDGTYSYASNVISGTYSDGAAWGAAYNVSYTEDGRQMIFTSTSDQGDVAVYEKCTIPEDVLSGNLESKSFENSEFDNFRFL